MLIDKLIIYIDKRLYELRISSRYEIKLSKKRERIIY